MQSVDAPSSMSERFVGDGRLRLRRNERTLIGKIVFSHSGKGGSLPVAIQNRPGHRPGDHGLGWCGAGA
jgi:hypothetical protein